MKLANDMDVEELVDYYYELRRLQTHPSYASKMFPRSKLML